MKIKSLLSVSLATMCCMAAQAQTQVVIPRGKLAVLKCGTADNSYPMSSARANPCFVQIFDPNTTNQSDLAPVLNVALSTNNTTGVWVNAHAGSEGGGISRSVNREYLVLEGYTGPILPPTAAKPSTDQTVLRGIVSMDAFTNATSIYASTVGWFGIPAGAPNGTQDNPTGIASMDGTNFWGTGNFAGTSEELDGTLFLTTDNSDAGNGDPANTPEEVQNYLQAAGEARIIGGTLYMATTATKKGAAASAVSGIYNFVDPSSGQVAPLPWDPDVANPYENFTFTNLFLNWGNTFQTILNFDMNPQGTIAYGADQVFGIVKFTNNGGAWLAAPYYFSPTNIGTATASQGVGCFGICVDFSGTNPVIYATTMEAGTNAAANSQGHQNQNRIIKIVDTGVAPGTNLVAQTLAQCVGTNEFFGGIDFTPDLTPLITTNPVSYSTTVGGSAPFSVGVQSVYALSYQWLQNGTNLVGQNSSTLTVSSLDTTYNNFTYACIVTNAYGAVTSAPAILTVTVSPVAPMITSGTNHVNVFIDGSITFATVTATGTQPFTSYQWYQNGTNLTDGVNADGSGFVGSQTPTLSVTNAQPAESNNYALVIANGAGYASNIVDVLTVTYQQGQFTLGTPAPVTTFTNVPTSLSVTETGESAPVSYQWFDGTTQLVDNAEYSGSVTPTLTIQASTTTDSATNYFVVMHNPGGSVTSALATVTVLIPPPHSYVNFTNQLYTQVFDSLPDPGGVSVNSINNSVDPGSVNGVFYSLANPFDFAYPVINNSYIGGLGLSTGATNMNGWYGCADTNGVSYAGSPVDGYTRFGAQDGDQTTGGDIDFGPDDVNGGVVGTNRALGLLSTSTTGSTAFALKLVNNSGTNLSYLDVSFLAELWRFNSGARTIQFGYAFDGSTNAFVLNSQSISNNTSFPCTLVPSLYITFPTTNLAQNVDGTQPSNEQALAVSSLPLSSVWTNGASLWLIWSMNYYGTGGGNGYAIDNLQVDGTSAATTVPKATTSAATKVLATTAQLNGTVNPSNGPTAYYFQYGPTASYGSSTPTNLLGNVNAVAASVNTALSGLAQLGTIHYRLVATNAAGVSLGADQSLTTFTNANVITLTASNLTYNAAQLNGSINPNNYTTPYWFRYGTSNTKFGSFSTTNTLAAGTTPVIVSFTGTSLTNGAQYFYSLVATNSGGTVNGATNSFVVPAVTQANLTGTTLKSGQTVFNFTNVTGASFSVLATNVFTEPLTNWPVVGHPVESPAGSGNYSFTNTVGTNTQLFYLLRQP